ncbi:hypothetical protein CK203_104425 [Vitis vinifera]|uniref:Retrotransposon gag domain-containing protein n=1 Tax=Vitis vinifera TaxID=29760 RepID=A0A438D979_VITVI|nr:hypothetical protein CK203_104425 [Vitis vinifera]
MAPSHRKKIVGKRTITASSPPGDSKIKKRKRGATHPGVIDGSPRHQHSRGQNVLPHRDPMVTPMVQNVHPHLTARQAGRNLLNEPPISSISKRLDDMLSTPFCSHIIHYESPRGFLVPKFSTYDGSSDPFDHIMHYRQLITLDIGNDPLLCKVFPANLQGQTLSWFHRLPPNSVDNLRDLSEAFVGQYLYSARHKQNISTL